MSKSSLPKLSAIHKAVLLNDVKPDDYHNDRLFDTPTLSASIAHTLISRSPLHAWVRHPRLGNLIEPPTKDTDRGSLIHALLLGSGREIAPLEYDNWMKKEARERRDEIRAAGAIPVLQKDFDEALQISEHIRRQLNAFGMSLTGQSEQPIVWVEVADDGEEVLCRGCIDHLIVPSFYDLKTTSVSAHPNAIGPWMIRYGCDIQAAAYTSGLNKLYPEFADRINGIFLYCEIEPPYAVVPAVPDGTMRELGHRKWQRAVNMWAHCLKNDDWPQYVTAPAMISAPIWSLQQEAQFGDLDIEL